MEDTGAANVQAMLDFLSRERIIPLVATARDIRDGIARHYDRAEDLSVVRPLGMDAALAGDEVSEEHAQRLAREKPVVRLVSGLIADAVARRASDIHLRPGENGTSVLFRIDDEMVPVRQLIKALHPVVVSRIKVLGSMDLADHRRAQDGRATFVLDDGRKVDLRISVLPAVFGESVVVRLLDTNESLWSLDQLGLTPEDRQRVDDVMQRSHGMFLTTGPTGCGKSTTLYAMLMELRKQRINVLTIEDPVEFHIEDIQQSPLRSDFACRGVEGARGVTCSVRLGAASAACRQIGTGNTAIIIAPPAHRTCGSASCNASVSGAQKKGDPEGPPQIVSAKPIDQRV